MSSLKTGLRRWVRGLRPLSKAKRDAASKKIIQKILQLECVQNAKTVGLYYSDPSEVDTKTLIKFLKKSGKKIAAPQIDAKKIAMKFRLASQSSHLRKNKFGIWEPKTSRPQAKLNQLDVIVVPGMAFDQQCNRLGHGLGYYDRALKNCRAIKIGLCFYRQLVEKIYADRFDVPMDFVVTEKTISIAKMARNV